MVQPRPFGWYGMLDKIFKNILEHSLLDAKGIMKNIHSFSCNNFLNKKWAWCCHAPRDADRTSTMRHALANSSYLYRSVIAKIILKKYKTASP